jgi:hypothetical protein
LHSSWDIFYGLELRKHELEKKISEIERKLILTKKNSLTNSDIWWEEHKRCPKIKSEVGRNTFGYFC